MTTREWPGHLTRWYSYANFPGDTGCAKIHFLRLGFRKLSYHSLSMHEFS